MANIPSVFHYINKHSYFIISIYVLVLTIPTIYTNTPYLLCLINIELTIKVIINHSERTCALGGSS